MEKQKINSIGVEQHDREGRQFYYEDLQNNANFYKEMHDKNNRMNIIKNSIIGGGIFFLAIGGAVADLIYETLGFLLVLLSGSIVRVYLGESRIKGTDKKAKGLIKKLYIFDERIDKFIAKRSKNRVEKACAKKGIHFNQEMYAQYDTYQNLKDKVAEITASDNPTEYDLIINDEKVPFREIDKYDTAAIAEPLQACYELRRKLEALKKIFGNVVEQDENSISFDALALHRNIETCGRVKKINMPK